MNELLPGQFSNLLPSFKDAQLSCGFNGYSQEFSNSAEGIVQIINGTSLLNRSIDYAIISTVMGAGKVYDFGGGQGTLYYSVRNHYNPIKYWRVIDQIDVIDKMTHLSDDRLSFHNIQSIPITNDCGTLTISHTLQYIEDYDVILQNLVQLLNPTSIFLDQLPVTENEIYFVQRLPIGMGGNYCPVTTISEIKLNNVLSNFDLPLKKSLPNWSPHLQIKNEARIYLKK